MISGGTLFDDAARDRSNHVDGLLHGITCPSETRRTKAKLVFELVKLRVAQLRTLDQLLILEGKKCGFRRGLCLHHG